jgi:uncharacterized membrane protein
MTRNAFVISAVAAALTLCSSATVLAEGEQSADNEKCFGVVKAGSNDCQTASNSCAGTAAQDGQGDAWIYLPKGLCEKLVGGSLEPKA